MEHGQPRGKVPDYLRLNRKESKAGRILGVGGRWQRALDIAIKSRNLRFSGIGERRAPMQLLVWTGTTRSMALLPRIRRTSSKVFTSATVGVQQLEQATSIPANRLMGMFGPNGHPSARNLFAAAAFGVAAHLHAQERVNFPLQSRRSKRVTAGWQIGSPPVPTALRISEASGKFCHAPLRSLTAWGHSSALLPRTASAIQRLLDIPALRAETSICCAVW